MNHVEFLNHLFTGTSGYFDITAINSRQKQVYTRCYQIGQEKPNWDQIMATNDAGWCIYYRVTTKRQRIQGYHARGKEDVSYMLPALYAEIDLKDGYYPTIDAMHQAIYDFPLPPTVIIHSGGGVHVLWRIKPIEITNANRVLIKQVLDGISIVLHSDPQVKDLARVLRLPGTHNKKEGRNNALCEVTDALPGQLTFDQFTHFADYAKPVERPIQRDLPTLPDDEQGAKLVEWYAANGSVPHQRNSLLNWTAHRLYTDGISEDKALAWLLPIWVSFGKDEKEGRDTIHSAYTGKRGVPSYISPRSMARVRAGDAVERKSG